MIIMGKDTVIVLSDGTEYKLSERAINFIEDLKKFANEKGISEDKIPEMLAALDRKDNEWFENLQRGKP